MREAGFSAAVGGRGLERHSVRGVGFWYPSVHVARAAATCRYRIAHLREHLIGPDVIIGRQLPASLAERLSLVCCVRPLVDSDLARQLDRLRAARVRLVADFDDLLFAGDVSGLPGSVRQHYLGAYAAALSAFDGFTVSTRALKRHLEALQAGPVALVPNGLSASWVEQGRSLYRAWQPGDDHVVRYFAGSPSHDDDLRSILSPLSRFLHDHPQVRLELVGPLQLDLSPFPAGSVVHLPSVPYDELPRLLASSWVNLAPLRDCDFTECKSAIKFLEAAAFACPTLASPNDDVRRHVERGAPVLPCRSGADWYGGLSRLLEPALRTEVGRASAAYVRSSGMASYSTRAWLEGVARTA